MAASALNLIGIKYQKGSRQAGSHSGRLHISMVVVYTTSAVVGSIQENHAKLQKAGFDPQAFAQLQHNLRQAEAMGNRKAVVEDMESEWKWWPSIFSQWLQLRFQ